MDIGVATITAFVDKRTPSEVSEDDLLKVAEQLKHWYSHVKSVQNFISVIFLNSAFTQSKMSVEEKEAYANTYLFAFREDHTPEDTERRCTFFPELAALTHAFRQHIPLLNGETIGNFSPMGTRGIPVSGLALLAIHVMPLGCLKCGGQLLGFHQLFLPDEDDGAMNVRLALLALKHNRQLILQMEINPEQKWEAFGGGAETRYVDGVFRALQTIQGRRVNTHNITGYYFTNYGPSPSLQILKLDNAVLDFLDGARNDASAAWSRVVASGWLRPKGEEGKAADETTVMYWHNRVYRRMFELPDNARLFVTFLARANDWHLIALFLAKVLLMDQSRIDLFRELGTRFARHILTVERGSLGFYYQFRRAKEYERLRWLLCSALEYTQKAGIEPLFTYDEYIFAFEHPADTYHSWKLARDLIAIRILEVLHKEGVQLPETSFADDESDESE